MKESFGDAFGWAVVGAILAMLTLYLYPDEIYAEFFAVFLFAITYFGGNIWSTLRRIEDGKR